MIDKFTFIQNKDLFISSKQWLGFVKVYLFEITNAPINIVASNEFLDKVLHSGIFISERYIERKKHIIRDIREDDTHGPFIIKKITPQDFKTLNYNEFVTWLVDYINDAEWSDEGRNEFIAHYKEVRQFISEYNLEKRDIYLINMDDFDPNNEKLTKYNFYSYYFTLIAPLHDTNQIMLISFGAD